VALRARFADEPRLQISTSDTQRVVAGIRHHDLAGWDLESALLWSHAKTRVDISGVIDDLVLLSELVDARGRALPGFRFGDPGANDPALMARLYPRVVDSGTSSTTSIDLRGTRELLRLPGGAAQLALGGELRRERFSTAPDPRTTSGELSILFGFRAAATQTIGSAYAELSVPLARTLEVSLAERYDHYSDFGGTANSKAGLKWQAAPGLALRGTYATAFRAPSPIETQQAPAASSTQVRDPRLCPVPSLANPNCDERVRLIALGNPALRPERATTETAGVVFEPWRKASFTVDAFRIRRRDQIGALNLAYLLAHEADLPGDVVRRADGTLLQLNDGTKNLGLARIWGIDATAKASATFEFGRIGFNGTYEWLPHYHLAAAPGLPLEELAGTNVQPKSRARVSLDFDRGPWRSSLTFNYTGKYLSVKTPSAACPYTDPAVNHPELCTIDSWHTVDLFIGYTGFRNLELGFLVNNLDNVQAPFDSTQTTNIFAAYQSAFHSAVGRFFKLTAKYTF
jgi:iron complex outermembrane receptor protein